jgi:hypothetical protein
MNNKTCPFCLNELKYSSGYVGNQATFTNYNHYYCENPTCLNDDMPRYQINFYKGDFDSPVLDVPSSCAFMIATYYVQIDFENNTTTISTLNSVLLQGSIDLPRALNFDMSDLKSVEARIKTLLTFS